MEQAKTNISRFIYTSTQTSCFCLGDHASFLGGDVVFLVLNWGPQFHSTVTVSLVWWNMER